MIVKNESECLGRALTAAVGLYDELIIVDTGSTDNTIAIAEAHRARVLHYDWQYPGNKGAARMAGIEQATGDWIVVLDADEMITNPSGLRHFLLNPPEAATAVNVLFENYDETGNITLKWYQVRCFRRGLYHYIHREHELPLWCGPDDIVPHELMLDVVFEHRAPNGRGTGKTQPMLDRLALDVAEHPTDPGPVYFYHRQHCLAGDFTAGLEWGHKYLALDGNLDRCECYGNMATCAYQLGDADAAIRWLHLAAAAQPNRRIWWVRLAEIYALAKMWNLALAHLRLASELWSSFEWQYEPGTNGMGMLALIERCQAELAKGYNNHG